MIKMTIKRVKKKLSCRINLLFSLLLISSWLFWPAVFDYAEEVDLLLKEAKNLSSTELLAIKNQLLKAESEGIPLNLITPRLKAGLAKQITANRLQAALENEIKLFTKARLILLNIDSSLILDDLIWQHTAIVLAWGVKEKELMAILKVCSNVRLAAYSKATALFISFAKWGISQELAGNLTVAAVLSKLPEEEWPGLLVILIKGRRLLFTPEKLSERILILIPKIKTIHELEEKILHE